MQRVIAGLYDSLDDVAAIDTALEALRRVLGASVALFAVVDRNAAIVARSINVRAQDFARYQSLIATDPWIRQASRSPRPSVFVGTGMVDQREVEKTVIYRELMRPNDMHFMIGCGVLGPSTGAFISAHRPRSKRDYSARTVDRVRALTPHVVRVARTMIQNRHSVELQDVATVPALRMGKRGLEFANAPAGDWLRRSSHVTWSRNRLRLKNHAIDVVFDDYVSKVLSGDPRQLPATPLELILSSGQSPTRLLVLPTVTMASNLQREPAVLVLVLDGRWRMAPTHAESFGLSEPEAQLADALIAGQTVAEHARTRCRSIHTIRSQLKSLLGKVGVHSQAQLVGKLLLLQNRDG